ncbi:MAG: 4Fe-4S dicluster domain-containing protein, partial [Croceimicrobium sp.]
NQCVDVCPTGIDIRNGTQLECTNCTACIDACDNIMDKTNKPRGLIRYDSENNIASGNSGKVLTGRVKAYIAILTVLLSLFAYLLVSRANVEAIFLRLPGQPLVKVDENTYSNAYNFKLLNKTAEDKVYSFRVISPEEGIVLKTAGEKETINVSASDLAQGAVILYLDTDQMTGMTTDIEIGIYEGELLVEEISTSFTGPFIKPKK